jgi:hypothetical protein
MAFIRSYRFQGDPLQLSTLRAGSLATRNPKLVQLASRAARVQALKTAARWQPLAAPGIAAAFARRGRTLTAYQGDPFKIGKFLKRVVRPPKFIRKMQPGKLLAKALPVAASFIPGVGGMVAQAAAGLLPQPASTMPPAPAEAYAPEPSGPVGQVVDNSRPEPLDFAALSPEQLYALILWSGIEVPGVTSPEVM